MNQGGGASVSAVQNVCTGAQEHDCDGGVFTAAFSADMTSVLVGGQVNFTDHTNQNPSTWTWSFQGGSPSSSNSQNPTVTYNTVGTYDVSLTASNDTDTDDEVKTGYITVLPSTAAFSMDFEACADFSQDFSPWLSNDADGGTPYGSNDYDFPGESGAMAFMAFNPSQTTPSASGDAALQPHGGDRFGAAISVASSSTPPNNDWLISPKLQLGTGSSFSLWVKTYKNDWGEERYRVGVSTTNENPSSFTIISSGSYEESSTTWQQKTYDLSSYDNQEVHVAVNCVSNDAFIFMIDDLSINTTLVNNEIIEVNDNIKVYPNPAVDYINVNIGNINNTKIVIFDVCGKAVKQIDLNESQATIDLSELSAGVYYVNIKTDNNTVVKKISLIR